MSLNLAQMIKNKLQEVAQPLSQGEKNFKDMHNAVNHKNLVPGVTDQDHVFKGSTKPYDNKHHSGYKPQEDVDAYDKNLRVSDETNKEGHETAQVEEEYISAKAATSKHIKLHKAHSDKLRAAKELKRTSPLSSRASAIQGVHTGMTTQREEMEVTESIISRLRANAEVQIEEVEQIEEMPSPRARGKATLISRTATAIKNASIHSKSGLKDYRTPWTPSKEKLSKMSAQATHVGAKIKEANEITDEELAEALTKSAKAADWIHDFVHSDNPKFDGKSTKERQKMALAAYYAKQNEEVIKEDVDYDYEGEMAKTELRAICDKADKLANMMSDNMELEAWLQSKISRAKDQIDSVYDYMMYKDKDEELPVAVAAAPSASPMATTYKSFLNRMGEEVEQVDEKSLAALAPPRDKVTKKDILVGRGILKKHPTDPEKHVLAKEEVETVEEAIDATMTDLVGHASDNQPKVIMSQALHNARMNMKSKRPASESLAVEKETELKSVSPLDGIISTDEQVKLTQILKSIEE